MEKNQALHAYIKEDLLNRIKSGTYQVGDRIPTELELCKDFDVSRTTVRTALKQLTIEGYLVRKQGNGTFVAEHKVKQTLSHTVKRYSDQIAIQGKKAEISVVSIQVIPATELLTKVLHVSINDPIQCIERVRKANGEPTQFEIAYIPWKLAPGITKEHAESSLYETLKTNYHLQIAKTTEHVEIAFPDDRVAHILKYKEGLPCFYIETVAEDVEGNVFEYSRSYFRGDKTNFVISRNYLEEE
ncbi:GntR family transcriptional regulator [Sporosarcina sp. D27]|uniref:GntR family transcriptional regulator n=1 Tax=Sporosarcina sp. D27 TaxID=1382305 RepID=UPI000472CEFA|nr:GntR family transcriptional regulator [Sporosarcina sp. D27]